MSKSLLNWVLVCTLALGSFASATTIVWVSESPDADSDGVIDDQPFVDWLEAQGYNVDLQRGYWMEMNAAKVEELNAADLVIFSRACNSGNYDEAGEADLWNSVTTPLLMQSAYLVRSSRWLWLDTTGVTNVVVPVYDVVMPSHPIFLGVPVENNQVAAVNDLGTGNTSMTNGLDSNGALIASSEGRAAIVEWTEGQEFYAGSGQIAGGTRLYFACGTWEDGGAAPQGDNNLTEAGTKMFLNAIRYLLGDDPGTASSPDPASGAVDVICDSLLSWKPGIYSGTQNLYLGESFQDVNSATVPTTTALDVNSFDPGSFEFDKTYYWRVDEVNSSPDKTVRKGNVWSFTAEPYSIQIAGSEIVVTASSYSDEYSIPENTNNGSGLGEDETHAVATETMWFTAMGDMDPWIQYEFDTVKKLDAMKVWNSNSAAESFIGYGVKNIKLEYSKDGQSWDTLEDVAELSRAPGLLTYNQYDEVALGGVAAKMVRLNIQSNFGGFMQAYSLSEVQFSMIPAAARTPEPASGSVDVLPNVVASWRAGREAAQSLVYVSTDFNEVTDGLAASATSNTNSIDLSSFDLQMGETYYWRVDEVNEAEAVSVWAGPVWSFSTVDAIVVEDFESYGNDSPDRPFQAWLDGYGYSADEFFPAGYNGNGTGAGIGHDIWSVASIHYNGEIMETTNTAPGSGQAMPFYYSNAGAVASQTERSFAPAQDWTLGGAKTLSIAFRGQTGNTGQLYAKINNHKIIYTGDPGNIALGFWQTWNIDLLSLNVQHVTTLQIGVDGNGASGMLLIDDMALSTTAVDPGDTGNKSLVVWVSLHGADNVPSGGAAGNGFTEAPDKAYTDLLKDNGYNVVRYVTTNDPSIETLNVADLVIISRSVASSGYQGDGATRWNSVTAPMMIAGGYTTRSSRMGFTTGTTMVDTTGDISLTVHAANHPVFAGIELVGGRMANPFAGIVVYPTDGTTVARGVSINDDPLNAEGTLLAAISDAGNGPDGAMVIAEWQAGATLTHDGGAGTDTLAGHRLVFLTGGREASGTSGDTAGLYDLYEDGEQMLLNAVEYMLQ